MGRLGVGRVIWPSMTAKKALPVRGTAIVVVKQLYSDYEYSSEEGPLLRVSLLVASAQKHILASYPGSFPEPGYEA